MPVINRDEGRWIARYRDEEGNTRDKSFGRGEQARLEAEKFVQEWEEYHENLRLYQQQQQAISEDAEIPQPEPFKSLKMVVLEYIQQARINGRSKNHITTLRLVGINVICKQLGEDIPVKDLDYAEHILPFLEWLQTTQSRRKEQRSTTTCNRYANFLKTFLNYAVARGYIERNPMLLWKKKYVERTPRLLSTEDLEKIIAHSPDHLKWGIEVAYHTGVRTGESELLSLKWSDVDYEKKLLHVYGRKTKTHRWIPIDDDDFLQHLREHQAVAKSEYIVEYHGKQVKNLHKSFRSACNAAGIPYPVRMYDVRHRYASALFANNVPVGVVSRLLGHSKVSTTTDVYLEVLPKEIFEIKGKLPKLHLPA